MEPVSLLNMSSKLTNDVCPYALPKMQKCQLACTCLILFLQPTTDVSVYARIFSNTTVPGCDRLQGKHNVAQPFSKALLYSMKNLIACSSSYDGHLNCPCAPDITQGIYFGNLSCKTWIRTCYVHFVSRH